MTNAATVIPATNNLAVGLGPFETAINFEKVIATINADVIIGTSGADTIDGNLGADSFIGHGGADRLYAGANLGSTGDGAIDMFRFDAATDSGITRATRDVIYQFEDALDKLEFSTLFDFNRVTASTQTPGSIGHFLNMNVAFDGTIGAIHAVQLGGQTIAELDTNGDKIANFSVALDGVHALTSANFLFDI